MKKFTCICFLVILLSGATAFGQSIELSSDSVTTLLCKKWEVDYALMGGIKIGKIPGATEINYEFSKDKTFLITSNNPKDNLKGIWSYDEKKKVIKLTANGKSNGNIISLKEGEFVLLSDTKTITPEDPIEISLVYKIKVK